MKNKRTVILLFLLIYCHSSVYSQYVTTGIYSGINFSDIHGQNIGGKWISKPGPVQGISFGYALNRSFGIQTGMCFSTVYYDHKSSFMPSPINPAEFYRIDPLYYYRNEDKMNFSFFRMPLLLTVSIPAVVRFNMRAGLFFSFVGNHSLNSGYYYGSNPDITRKKDFGYMFSSGLSYPLNTKTTIVLNISYLSGRKTMVANSGFRNGCSEFTLGIDYNFLKKDLTDIPVKAVVDSSSKKVTVTYSGGINYSWNLYGSGLNKYSQLSGPSVGFSLNFPMGRGVFFISGVSFERKGYSMKDSSTSFYQNLRSGSPMYYVNSKVQIDYAVIPFLLSLKMGKSQNIFFNTGPWIGIKINARNTGFAYNESHSGSSYNVTKTVVYDDIEKLVKDDDFGWIFSGGVSLPVFNRYKIALALQYSSSFNNVFNPTGVTDQQNPSPGYLKIRNQTISFLIGFTLPVSEH